MRKGEEERRGKGEEEKGMGGGRKGSEEEVRIKEIGVE